MKIGIITAMSSEQKQVAQLLENKKEYTEGTFQYTEGTIKKNTIILMKRRRRHRRADPYLPSRLCHQYRCGRRYRQLPENNGCGGEPADCIS